MDFYRGDPTLIRECNQCESLWASRRASGHSFAHVAEKDPLLCGAHTLDSKGKVYHTPLIREYRQVLISLFQALSP